MVENISWRIIFGFGVGVLGLRFTAYGAFEPPNHASPPPPANFIQNFPETGLLLYTYLHMPSDLDRQEACDRCGGCACEKTDSGVTAL